MATVDESGDGSAPDAYEELTDRYARITYLGHTGMQLNWDQQVMMPEGGTPARAKQLSALSSVRHDLVTDDELEELLSELEGGETAASSRGASGETASSDLNDEQRAVVREVRRAHDRAVDVPPDLVAELSEHQSTSQQTWKEAKGDDDFDAFAPALETLRDLQRDRAGHVTPDANPYEVMFEDREPHLPLETVEEIFDELREHLVPLIDEIREEGRDLPSPFVGTYDDEEQMALCQDALDLLGYDRVHGRLDTAPHPFMSGTQFDARITTRFREDDPIDALTATIHEFGHASYQLGLRRDEYGSPLGESLSSGVHESQSRFWENHVGRTRPFWELFLPRMKEHFPRLEDVTVDEAYAAVNRIYPENLIRVEADELTYHLHIILRCEIDRAFVEGEIGVEEIPELWNEKMDDYLGVTPDTDAEGALQDIHWSYNFAAFQHYTVGSVLAAQLDAAMREDLAEDVDDLVRHGEFDPLREWMERNVHRHGQRYPTEELVEVATGEPLTAKYFLEYVDEKFGDLYEI